MKFLLVSESAIDLDIYLKMYIGDYIEHSSDVVVRYSVQEARDYIINALLGDEQKHLDFVIADYHSKAFYQQMVELGEWLRQSENTYSSQNFKLNALPLFLMNNLLRLERHYYQTLSWQYSELFDGIVYKPDGNHPIGISNNDLAKGLDHWLDRLKDDIDNLDTDIGRRFKVDAKLLSARAHKLKVLSPTFANKKQPLNYLWVGNNLKIVESTGDKLIALLKTYNQNTSKRNEKGVHEFLRDSEHLLKSEKFCHSIYEQHFYHQDSRKYEEVDFWNFAHPYTVSGHELLEIKLPNQRFFSKTTGRMLKLTQQYYRQIGVKYYNYFSDPTNKSEINLRLEKHELNISDQRFEYALLMGRDEDRLQNVTALQDFAETLPVDVRLLTYDDLIKRHHYLHQRITRFGIN